MLLETAAAEYSTPRTCCTPKNNLQNIANHSFLVCTGLAFAILNTWTAAAASLSLVLVRIDLFIFAPLFPIGLLALLGKSKLTRGAPIIFLLCFLN
jgi:hypothetical protein